jgi:hypothetical protein
MQIYFLKSVFPILAVMYFDTSQEIVFHKLRVKERKIAHRKEHKVSEFHTWVTAALKLVIRNLPTA